MKINKDGTPGYSATEKRWLLRGQHSWQAIRKGGERMHWIQVAEALAIGREYAAILAKQDPADPGGSLYNAIYSEWLKTNRFGDMDTHTRFDCLWMYDNRAEVEQWFIAKAEKAKQVGADAGLVLVGKLRRLNHPSTIKRRYEREFSRKRRGSPQKAKAFEALRLMFPEVAEELDRLAKEWDDPEAKQTRAERREEIAQEALLDNLLGDASDDSDEMDALVHRFIRVRGIAWCHRFAHKLLAYQEDTDPNPPILLR
jgi:hypothetical protein